MKYVFDTTAYSNLVRGDVHVAEMVRSAENIYLPNVVMAELAYGFRLGSRRRDNERLLARFVSSDKVKVLLPDNAIMQPQIILRILQHMHTKKALSYQITIYG